jgi:dual specificity MAP kinase phosphatase
MSFYLARRIGSNDGAELWIGSAADASNDEWLREHDIRLVVNCTRDLPFTRLDGMGLVRVAVHDDPSENSEMLAALPAATLAIARALDNGENVLVHCRAGMQRSATVAAAALYRMGVGPMRDIVTGVRRQKGETFPPGRPDGLPTFVDALAAWEKMCKRANPNLE